MRYRFKNNIWNLYHLSSKDRAKGHPPISYNVTLWPDSWHEISYKSYERLPLLSLPEPCTLDTPFSETIRIRTTNRAFSGTPLKLEQMSSLLKWSCGMQRRTEKDDRRTYASGGRRFPVEIYFVHFRDGADLKSGVYHYDFRKHALNVLWERPFQPAELDELFTYPWSKRASGILLMTAVFDRTIQKYGERGYRYALLEAGHIGQNVYLAAAALHMKCSALGGVNEEAVEALLDMEESRTESLVYALLLGT